MSIEKDVFEYVIFQVTPLMCFLLSLRGYLDFYLGELSCHVNGQGIRITAAHVLRFVGTGIGFR
jgi:hypothetical protein